MSRPKLADELGDAFERGLFALAFLPEVERRMRACLSEPGGHGFEVVSRATPMFCEDHQQDLSDCHAEARRQQVAFACTGVPVDVASDPTGEGACRDHEVWERVRELQRHARRLIDEIAWLDGFVTREMRDDRVPLRDPKGKDALPLCEVHLRFGHQRPARSSGTTVKDHGRPILTRPMALCEWCEDTTRKLGRVPLEVEVLDHIAGKRLRVIRDDETAAEERRRDRRTGGDAA